MDPATAPRRRWFGRRRSEEDRALTRETIPAAFLPDGGDSPEAPGIHAARRVADVYACLRVLSLSSALVPLGVYRQQGKQTAKVEDGATVDLLKRPAPAVSGPALVGQMVAGLAAAGEVFIGLFRNGPDDSITQLALLDASRVKVETVGGEPRYTYTSQTGRISENLTADDVIHIPGPLVDEWGRGISPIRACRDAVSLAQSLTTSAAALHANGARPDGIVSIPEGPGADDQAQALSDGWAERHQGPKRAGTTAFVTGEVSYTQVQLSAADAAWVETKQLSTQEICRILGVRPWMIAAAAGSQMTYSNVTEEMAAHIKFDLSGPLALIEAALSLNTELFPAGQFARFDLDGLLRGDANARAERNTKALHPQTGWMTKDEVREAEGLAPEGVPA